MDSATIKKERKLSKTKTNRLIFYSIFIAVPVIHFLVFYVYININSILMSFKEYELTGAQGYVAVFAGFKNFAAAWQGLVSRGFMVKNSLIFLASDCLIITPLAVLFSFYLYRQAPLSGFFKAILFMPQLLSGVILGLLYKYIASDVYLWLAEKLNMTVSGGLLDTVQTQLGASLAFNIFMGFGVSHLFTNQYNMYTLFGNGAGRTSTLGYFLYVQAMESALVAPRDNLLSYPVLSALGLILTAIILPITMYLRHLMNKYGPSAD